MTRKRKPYKTYSKEFKLEALRLMEESERPASEIAMQLGIRRNQTEITRLRQELERVKEENEILKKAAAFFAKELD